MSATNKIAAFAQFRIPTYQWTEESFEALKRVIEAAERLDSILGLEHEIYRDDLVFMFSVIEDRINSEKV